MQALRYSEGKGLRLEQVPLPSLGERDALIKVRRAGVCNTDIELMKGYVPGYDLTLGHEFVGDVVSCPADPALEGRRVVGEINCRCDAAFAHPDPIFVRNHAPERTVLGIIAKDGCMAEYVTLPRENLFTVPEELTDAEACFAEPLAAACRVVEQKVRLWERVDCLERCSARGAIAACAAVHPFGGVGAGAAWAAPARRTTHAVCALGRRRLCARGTKLL
jgi:threonine dehydrogenase-like Zn-dependent dehydrogenase